MSSNITSPKPLINNNMSSTIKHLNNLTNYFFNNNSIGVQNLQPYYLNIKRSIEDIMSVPQKGFNELKVCTRCSTIYKPESNKVRIVSIKRGKQINKNLNQKNENPKNKSMKNKNQLIHIKCLNCKKNSIITINKPAKKKLIKETYTENNNSKVMKKKKKKRQSDKFCNLNISTNNGLITSLNHSLSQKTPTQIKSSTPIQQKNKLNKYQSNLTPIQKISQMNKLKLESVLNNSNSKKRKSGLSSFLNELF